MGKQDWYILTLTGPTVDQMVSRAQTPEVGMLIREMSPDNQEAFADCLREFPDHRITAEDVEEFTLSSADDETDHEWISRALVWIQPIEN